MLELQSQTVSCHIKSTTGFAMMTPTLKNVTTMEATAVLEQQFHSFSATNACAMTVE